MFKVALKCSFLDHGEECEAVATMPNRCGDHIVRCTECIGAHPDIGDKYSPLAVAKEGKKVMCIDCVIAYTEKLEEAHG